MTGDRWSSAETFRRCLVYHVSCLSNPTLNPIASVIEHTESLKRLSLSIVPRVPTRVRHHRDTATSGLAHSQHKVLTSGREPDNRKMPDSMIKQYAPLVLSLVQNPHGAKLRSHTTPNRQIAEQRSQEFGRSRRGNGAGSRWKR